MVPDTMYPNIPNSDNKPSDQPKFKSLFLAHYFTTTKTEQNVSKPMSNQDVKMNTGLSTASMVPDTMYPNIPNSDNHPSGIRAATKNIQLIA